MAEEGREMMSNYEPSSGYNLPPGCTTDDIDRHFGSVTTCGECSHCLEGCCDYGICELAFEEAFDKGETRGKTHWETANKVLDWVVDNYVDMQVAACERFE